MNRDYGFVHWAAARIVSRSNRCFFSGEETEDDVHNLLICAYLCKFIEFWHNSNQY